jgi:hypothetical protein
MEIDSSKPPTVHLPDDCDKAFEAYLKWSELRFNSTGERPSIAKVFRAGWLAGQVNVNKIETKEEPA